MLIETAGHRVRHSGKDRADQFRSNAVFRASTPLRQEHVEN